MFFPKLTRRSKEEYHHRGGGFYADYKQNHDKVAADCKHRCVYCDILTIEMGGEGMHLDHFRPQNHFKDLEAHPHNLYLACPKCNQLKSDDWPCSKDVGAPSFIGGIGYLDPFEHDPADYLEIDAGGLIIQKGGPVNYMIKRMLLNRQSRAQIRRRRLLAKKKEQLSSSVTRLIEKLLEDMQGAKNVNIKDFAERLAHILSLKKSLDES
jgi:hypothetical protein